MKARSYLGHSSLVVSALLGVAALTLGGEAAHADPPVPYLPRQFQADGQPPETDFLFRGHGAIEPPYKAANGSFVTIESLVEPSPPVGVESEDRWTELCAPDCPPLALYRVGAMRGQRIPETPTLTLDRARRAQELATAPRSTKRAVGWSFTPLGLFLGGLGIAAAIGEFDPGRTRTTITGARAPSDMAARAAAGTTFLALGIPMVCVGVWALLSSDHGVRDASGHFVARDTIPITTGLALGPQGLVF